MSTITVDHHTIELGNQDKVLFPESRITKGRLIEYYHAIAPIMLSHIFGHPIAMQRFPDGIAEPGFYQKNIDEYFPDWIERVTIKRKSDAQGVDYVMCNNAATLVYLANQAVITIHLLLNTVGKLKYPDRMVFDLDPIDVPWSAVVETAQVLKKELENNGLTPFVMTTGSKGLHVTVPLAQKNTFAQVRRFAQKIAQKIIDQHPQRATLEVRKEKRAHKVFIDTLRNQPAQHAVAPYAVRPLEHAPVAMPLFWKELDDQKLMPQTFTIANTLAHVKKNGDAWRDFHDLAGSLGKLD